MCSALDPDKGTELELTVYTLTVHDGGVNQGLCAESKMYIDDLRVKGGVILGRGWEVHVFFCERAALRLRCSAAGRGVLSWVHVVFVSAQRCCTLHGTALNPSTNQRTNFVPRQRHRCGCAVAPSCSESCPRASAAAKPRAAWATVERSH